MPPYPSSLAEAFAPLLAAAITAAPLDPAPTPVIAYAFELPIEGKAHAGALAVRGARRSSENATAPGSTTRIMKRSLQLAVVVMQRIDADTPPDDLLAWVAAVAELCSPLAPLSCRCVGNDQEEEFDHERFFMAREFQAVIALHFQGIG